MHRLRRLVLPSRAGPFDAHEREALERIIAYARLIVSISSFVATRFGPPEVEKFAGVIDIVLAAYCAYSIVAVLLVEFRPDLVVYRGMEVEGIDLFWAAAVTSVTGGPSSHFSPPLFVFALLVAAYRWGFLETAVVGAASLVVVAITAILAREGVLGVPLDAGDFVMREVWLAVVTLVLGYLAEWNRGLVAESAMLARIGRQVRIQTGLAASVRAVLGEVQRGFGASRALLVSEDLSSGQTVVWSAPDPGGNVSSDAPLELAEQGRTGYLFPVPPDADTWGAQHRRLLHRGSNPVIRGVDGAGTAVTGRFRLPDRVADGVPWSSIMLTTTVIDDWRVRLLIVDPTSPATNDAELRFLQTVARQVSPALINLYLARRLRTKVAEAERGRLARELHDGVIQSLIGLEFEMEVARQRVAESPAEGPAALERMRDLLREQIAEVRTLIRQMRPLRANGRTLVRALADVVAAHARSAGLTATFESEVNEVDLAPRVCTELVKVAAEAMVNARKHSRATTVVVKFGPVDGDWRLLIDDNGLGFDFAGRLSGEQLRERRLGPEVLMERVREIGGHMWLQSTPRMGARLDIRLPRSQNL